jgi:hypothetical protein
MNSDLYNFFYEFLFLCLTRTTPVILEMELQRFDCMRTKVM